MNKQVEIATDVLKTIELNNIVVKAGSYITFNKNDARYTLFRAGNTERSIESYANTIHDLINNSVKDGVKCEVCALGAMLVTKCGDEKILGILHRIQEPLLNYFDIKSLALIELAFEGTTNGLIMDHNFYNEVELNAETGYDLRFDHVSNSKYDISAEEVYMGIEFYSTHSSHFIEVKSELAKKRLQKIMQHIIDNGKFDLGILYNNE